VTGSMAVGSATIELADSTHILSCVNGVWSFRPYYDDYDTPF
jgi:hypothetical protein